MKIESIIETLENAEKLRVQYQEQLREHVLDKSIPLEERFLVWVTHCNKIDHDTAGVDFEKEIKVLGITISGCNTITWSDVLRGVRLRQIDKIKELLIEENFGSTII